MHAPQPHDIARRINSLEQAVQRLATPLKLEENRSRRLYRHALTMLLTDYQHTGDAALEHEHRKLTSVLGGEM